MTDRARLLRALEKHGRATASFQTLEPGLAIRWDEETEDAAVVYFDTGSAWVAAGDPIAPAAELKAVARRFVDAARAKRRRASFFCCEEVDHIDGKKMQLGEQPMWRPARWPDVLVAHRRIREQIRRARAKKVTVRAVPASELAHGTELRSAVDVLAEEWLGTRPMEPMQFLVALDLFEEPERHRYYAAERDGQLVAFLSVIPIYGKNGRFIEDLVRSSHAPNGTTELLLDRAIRDAASDGIDVVTLGLAPLSGTTSAPLRVARLLGRGLYDFRGVRAFKERLRPDHWEPVWMVHEGRTPAALALLDALTAFAGGSLLSFGVRTLVKRPLVAAWLLTLLLVPWTIFLATLAAFSDLRVLSYDRVELLSWVAFDAAFAYLLLRAFLKPSSSTYAALAFLAACDGALAVGHFATLGLGATPFTFILRPLATLAPLAAAVALARCAAYVRRAVS